jgi:hypothetical protein
MEGSIFHGRWARFSIVCVDFNPGLVLIPSFAERIYRFCKRDQGTRTFPRGNCLFGAIDFSWVAARTAPWNYLNSNWKEKSEPLLVTLFTVTGPSRAKLWAPSELDPPSVFPSLCFVVNQTLLRR